MCDLRIASEGARFAESFVKLGIVTGDGGAWLLPRIVGWSRRARWRSTAISCRRGKRSAGLVSQVVPEAELMPAARHLAERIAANPPLAVRATKREGRFTRLDSLLQLSAGAQVIAHTTAEHKAALTQALNRKGRAPSRE